MSENVIPFPERKPTHARYCGNCHASLVIPPGSAWPQACPSCKATPFVVVSSPSISATFVHPPRSDAR